MNQRFSAVQMLHFMENVIQRVYVLDKNEIKTRRARLLFIIVERKMLEEIGLW